MNEDDDDRRDGVAADELRGTVHRAVKVGGALDVFAPLARLGLGNEAGVEVGVDGELLAGHRVERETRGDFRDAAGAVGDDDELDHDEDREDHDPDRVVPPDDDRSEPLDDLAGVAVQQDQTGPGNVQREPEQRHDQQQRREDAELQRVLGVEGHQQDHQRQADVHRQEDVQQPRRDRDDHQDDQEHRGRGNPDVRRGRKPVYDARARRGPRCH